MAQLSNAVVQPASMLAQPSSMLAQLRIWIGYGSDLVFERRPETSSTARFSKEAGRPETKGEPPPNQGRKPVQSKGENLPPLVSDASPLDSPLVLVPPLVSRPWFWAFALGLELQIQGRSN